MHKVTRSYKFEAHPTKEQIEYFQSAFRASLFLYNACIEWYFNDRILWQEGKASCDMEPWAESRTKYVKGESGYSVLYANDRAKSATDSKFYEIPKGTSLANVATRIRKEIIAKYLKTNIEIASIFNGISAISLNSIITKDFGKAVENGFYVDDLVIKRDGKYFVSRLIKGCRYEYDLKNARGLPNFKNRNSDPINTYYDGSKAKISQCYDGNNKLFNICLERFTANKLGTLKFYAHRHIDFNKVGLTKTITMSGDGRWWIVFTLEEECDEVKYPIDVDTTIGVDFGSTVSAITSNGSDLINNKSYIKYDKMLTKMQHAMAHKRDERKRLITLCASTTCCPKCHHDSPENVTTNHASKRLFRCVSCEFNPYAKSKNYLKLLREYNKLNIKITNIKKNAIGNFTAKIVNNDSIHTVIMKETKLASRLSSKKGPKKKRSAIKRTLASSSIGMIKQDLINKLHGGHMY